MPAIPAMSSVPAVSWSVPAVSWPMPAVRSVPPDEDGACWAPIHAMVRPGGAIFGSPHRSSQPSSIPRWLDWVWAMSYARRRTSSSRVPSRTTNDISTAC